MHEAFFNYIKHYTALDLTPDEADLIRRSFTPMRIRRRQYFLKEGDVCKQFAFVVKGAMRQYLVDEKGNEHVVHLAIENWWIGDRESWVALSPTTYCIDACEDSELLLITRADVVKLVQQVPAFNALLLLLDERNKIANQKRITSSISFTAEKRYADFASAHPELLQRFPQHIIASYLGITKETLSRVRKQALLQS